MAPDGLPHRRRRAGRAGRAEGHDGSTQAASVQGGQGGTGPADRVDHDRGKGITGRRFERRGPALVHVDQLQQGAQGAGHAGQAFGSGTGAGLVEGHRQRFGSRRPGGPIRAGGLERPVGPTHRLVQLAAAFGALQLGGQGAFGVLGGQALGPKPFDLGIEPSHPLRQLAAPWPSPGGVALGLRDGRPQAGAARRGPRRPGAAPCLSAPGAPTSASSKAERSAVRAASSASSRRRSGRSATPASATSTPSASSRSCSTSRPAGVGLGQAIPFGDQAPAPLAHNCRQAAGPLAQLLGAGQVIAQIGAPGGGQAGLGGHHVGVEAGQLGLHLLLGAGQA